MLVNFHSCFLFYGASHVISRRHVGLRVVASDLALSSGGSQCRIESAPLIGSQLSTIGATTTPIATKDFALEAIAELRRELPLFKEVLRKLLFKASDDVLADHREELECATYCVSIMKNSGSGTRSGLTARFHLSQ